MSDLDCSRCRYQACEFCFRCAREILCAGCWDEYGCCEADEGSGACVTSGGILIPPAKTEAA